MFVHKATVFQERKAKLQDPITSSLRGHTTSLPPHTLLVKASHKAAWIQDMG